jgi:hypothetical protein
MKDFPTAVDKNVYAAYTGGKSVRSINTQITQRSLCSYREFVGEYVAIYI